MSSLTQSLLFISFFVALIAAVPWMLKQLQARLGLGTRSGPSQSQWVSAIAVGPQQRVVTVEVGPAHARVCLVLGVTAQTITCLHSAPATAPDLSNDTNAESAAPRTLLP